MVLFSQTVTYLECKISLPHPQVCADMLVDGPCKFIIQLPANNAHQHCRQGDNARDRNQGWLNKWPNVFSKCFRNYLQGVVGIFDLIHLDGRIHEHSSIEDANADNLNGVLQPQSIITQDHEEHMSENEKGKVTEKSTVSH